MFEELNKTSIDVFVMMSESEKMTSTDADVETCEADLV
jgi:hypothetical protein